jgi:diaminopimelate decarboxylase
VARRRNAVVNVAVRVNPGPGVAGGAMRMGGKPAPFGVDEERLQDVVAHILAEPALALRGIHLYLGTQILDHRILLTQYRQALDIARRVAGWSGRPLATVDLGGGLGVPYFANESELDGRAAATSRRCRHEADPGCRYALRVSAWPLPVAEAHYVARVVDIKTSRGKTCRARRRYAPRPVASNLGR